MNVYINTKSMKNRENADKINDRAGKALEEGIRLADQVYDIVLGRLKGNEKR